MGGKYEVRGAMSGLCPFWDGQFTNSLAHALLLLIRFSLKKQESVKKAIFFL